MCIMVRSIMPLKQLLHTMRQGLRMLHHSMHQDLTTQSVTKLSQHITLQLCIVLLSHLTTGSLNLSITRQLLQLMRPAMAICRSLLLNTRQQRRFLMRQYIKRQQSITLSTRLSVSILRQSSTITVYTESILTLVLLITQRTEQCIKPLIMHQSPT